MQKNIELIFHNRGLRSYIEVDLCRECPRMDNKGCCGYYSPVFYPSDFAYLLKNSPGIVDYIFNIKDITILDWSVTANNTIDGDSYLCHFHTRDKGCLLEQDQRESVCRHFVCPGIGWENEASLKHWKQFFDLLSDYEIKLNNRIGEKLMEMGLTLRDTSLRRNFFKQMLALFEEEMENPPDFFYAWPADERVLLTREIKFKEEWPL